MRIRSAHPDVRASVKLHEITAKGNRIEFRVGCIDGKIHHVIWEKGLVRIKDHSPDDQEDNRAFRALGGPPYPCFLVQEWLSTGVYFEP
jgi:hypothetical protein